MAEDQLVARVGVALQHVAEPRRLDMALAAQARPHRVDENHQEVAAPHKIGQALLSRRPVTRQMTEHRTKCRLAHLVVGRVVAGRVPQRNGLAIEPGHLTLQPMTPLRLELGTIGRQARDLVAQEGDELRRRFEALHDGVDRRKGLLVKSAGNA
jgi:hypothetical protein